VSRRAVIVVAALAALATSGCGAPRETGAVPPPSAPEAVTQARVTRGGHLYVADGCVGCHSLDGKRGVGPTFKGLAGRRVALAGGRTVEASNAYLTRAIVRPDADVVAGFPGGVMGTATGRLRLAQRPADVRALVEFINSIGNTEGTG
jgi:cytochrome c oxidase subunit 2